MATHAPARIATRPSPAAPPSLVDYHLADYVCLDYVVGPGKRVVRVHFPDDARALLESLSWRPGASILGALDAVARGRLEALGDAELQIQVPLAHLRAALSSLVSG